MSFSKHANNKANNIYVMGKDYIQKINDTQKTCMMDYDFVVDYEHVAGTAKILDMHRYLINKHTIISQ